MSARSSGGPVLCVWLQNVGSPISGQVVTSVSSHIPAGALCVCCRVGVYLSRRHHQCYVCSVHVLYGAPVSLVAAAPPLVSLANQPHSCWPLLATLWMTARTLMSTCPSWPWSLAASRSWAWAAEGAQHGAASQKRTQWRRCVASATSLRCAWLCLGVCICVWCVCVGGEGLVRSAELTVRSPAQYSPSVLSQRCMASAKSLRSVWCYVHVCGCHVIVDVVGSACGISRQ